MNMMRKANAVLLEALGVDWIDRGVIGVTLRIRAGKLPTVTVHRLLDPKKPIGEVTERFALTPIGQGDKP